MDGGYDFPIFRCLIVDGGNRNSLYVAKCPGVEFAISGKERGVGRGEDGEIHKIFVEAILPRYQFNQISQKSVNRINYPKLIRNSLLCST